MKITFTLILVGLFSFLNAQHSIVLKSGDKIECVVLSLNDDVWQVYQNGEERSIPMKEVSSIFFQ